jgi:hypothetical protein
MELHFRRNYKWREKVAKFDERSYFFVDCISLNQGGPVFDRYGLQDQYSPLYNDLGFLVLNVGNY